MLSNGFTSLFRSTDQPENADGRTGKGSASVGIPTAKNGGDADYSRAALTQGFGWVLLYGGVSACVLAAASFLVFGRKVDPVR